MSVSIVNAKDKSLTDNPSNLPNVSDALLQLFQPIKFTKVTKSLLNYSVTEVETSYDMMGVRQPLSAQKLAMKPEGQRQWQWEMIHAFPDLILIPDEIIVFNTVRYRVMEKFDWKEYGYVEYHIQRSFLPPNYVLTEDNRIVGATGPDRVIV